MSTNNEIRVAEPIPLQSQHGEDGVDGDPPTTNVNRIDTLEAHISSDGQDNNLSKRQV